MIVTAALTAVHCNCFRIKSLAMGEHQFTYKEIDGQSIDADVYYDGEKTSASRPVGTSWPVSGMRLLLVVRNHSLI